MVAAVFHDLDSIVVKSTDGGFDWGEFFTPYDCSGSTCEVHLEALALDPEEPDSGFVSGSYFFNLANQGYFLKRGDGQTWKNLHAIHNLRALAFVPGHKGAMLGANCRGLFKSETGGASWRKVGKGLPQPYCGGSPLAIDPLDPRRIYVGTSGHGVFASSDGGATFSAMNKGLESAEISTLLIDPTDPARLYAAAVPRRGVFQWKAGLRRWAPLNDGLPLTTFNGVLALDPQAPSILYAGTADQGIFRLDLGPP